MKLAVVCGLVAEAKIAAAPGVGVIAAGGIGARVRSGLDALSPRPGAVLSFGIAGGLSADLSAGDVRVCRTVVEADGRCFAADSAWSAALATCLGAAPADFAGTDAPVLAVADKRALHVATGADLVDMESHHAAAWAAENGAAFAAVRVVTDSAERTLPHAAAVGMRPDGTTDLLAILKSVAKSPGQMPALIRTGLDARAAFAGLLRCRQRLGPRFALLDLG